MSKKRWWTVDVSPKLNITVEDIEAETEREAREIAIDRIYNDPCYYLDIDPDDRFCVDAWDEGPVEEDEDEEEQPA